MWTLITLAVCCLQLALGEDSFALDYLKQYNYLGRGRADGHDVNTAIKRFQTFFKLPVTGRIDEESIAQMKKPRCGNPDLGGLVSHDGRSDGYFKWKKNPLTYYIEYTSDLPESTQDVVFKKQLETWGSVTPLRFTQTDKVSEADIRISFGYEHHGGVTGEGDCHYPFREGVLAHAFYPSDGRAHFNDAGDFTDGTDEGLNLAYVALHEFGHAMGLPHSSVRDSIMWPSYEGYRPNLALHEDDIEKIQKIYGSGGTEGVTEEGTESPTEGVTEEGTESPTEGETEENCEDLDKLCEHWIVYCENSEYVKENCLKSCKKC